MTWIPIQNFYFFVIDIIISITLTNKIIILINVLNLDDSKYYVLELEMEWESEIIIIWN